MQSGYASINKIPRKEMKMTTSVNIISLKFFIFSLGDVEPLSDDYFLALGELHPTNTKNQLTNDIQKIIIIAQ